MRNILKFVNKFCEKIKTSEYEREGHTMAQLVEALRYKPKARRFDSRCQWTFFIDNPSGRTMALGLTQPLTEMSIRNIS